MMTDSTEALRKFMVLAINLGLSELESERYAQLAMKYGADNVWTTTTLQDEFVAIGFMAPYVVVRRKGDGVVGTMTFCHSPRFYFDFRPDKKE